MKRREFITSLGGAAAAWPLAVRAQQSGKMYRIGYLTAGTFIPELRDTFYDTLRTLGWLEGTNVIYEERSAENRLERLPDLAAALVRLNVDVIAAAGTIAPLAAKRATATIPIVMTSAGDPLGSGLVASLARPGGNVTGMSLMAPDLGGKRLVRGPDDFNDAFKAARQHDLAALVVVEDPLTVNHRTAIADFAAAHQLPALYGTREYVAVGGLLSYGASLTDLNRRAAGYVDKILKGAKPADLPVQQPSRFEFVINLKVAKALGVDIPATVLARADEVIE
jgi:putative tryptophan/tyrosine transport system substrate-binding protein